MIAPERIAQMKQNARGLAESENYDQIVHKVKERIQDFPNDPQFQVWLECLEEARAEVENENS